MGSNQPAAETSAWWIACGGLLAGCLSDAAVERRASRALVHERRRVAADVHDLVMQDLSLALANARTLAGERTDTPQASLVVSAGERALAGARVILSGTHAGAKWTHAGAPWTHARGQWAHAGAHAGVRTDRARHPGQRPSSRSQHPAGLRCPWRPAPCDPTTAYARTALHIAREAVTNATKHTRSDAILLTLQYTGRWHLTVRDEGNGFDARGADPSGFGLTSMRDTCARSVVS